MRSGALILLVLSGLATLFVLVVPQWHWPVKGTELGYRAGALVQFDPPPGSITRADFPPPPVADEPSDPRPATEVFKNVQVLTDIDAGRFMRLQHAMTEWVAPKQGCGFCHAGSDYASEANPRKEAARLMLRLTRYTNTVGKAHLGAAGVTCYTCHRGEAVPSQVWFPSPPRPIKGVVAQQEDWNESADTVRKFFPNAAWDEYLLQSTPGLAQSYTALPSGEVESQEVAKRLYEMMMQMSDGIGVNCGYCHNSRAFFDWSQSTPMRWAGHSGIQLTRQLNSDFLVRLAAVLPQSRTDPTKPRPPIIPEREVDPQAGNALAVCATCHHGQPKPFGGANLAADYPALARPQTSSDTTGKEVSHAAR